MAANDHLEREKYPSLIDELIIEALDEINGPRETYRPLLDPINILQRICRTAEGKARRRRTEPWVIISDITGHGSGVSAAIYSAYREHLPEDKKPNP